MVNKKAFFLTFIAILLVSLFILYFDITTIKNDEPIDYSSTVKSRVLSGFVTDLEEFHFKNILALATHRAINGIINYIETENEFIPESDFQGMFYQMLTNGTIQPYSTTTTYSNISLTNLIGRLVSLASSELNIDMTVNYSTYKYRVYQSNAWQISVDVLFEYTVIDSTMTWENRTQLVTATVPIYGMRDPLFILHNAPYTPIIKDSGVISGTWDKAKLLEHIDSLNYTENNNSPSYLKRLMNLTTNSTYGIESLINPLLMGTTGSAQNRSFVDYLYWTYPWTCTPGPQNLLEVAGISDDADYRYFRLDDEHLVRYITGAERISDTSVVCFS